MQSSATVGRTDTMDYRPYRSTFGPPPTLPESEGVILSVPRIIQDPHRSSIAATESETVSGKMEI